MKKFALLISGGVDAAHNYGRYLNDLTEIYKTLRDNYGYEKDDISVLYGAGNAHDLDGDGQNEINNPATKEKVVEVFNDLKNKMTDEDILFIFTTNHGGQSSPNTSNARLWLWQHEYIEDVEFKTHLDQLKSAIMIITMGQCYSGGFLDNLQGPNRIIATACDWNEVSYACDSEGNYDEFVFHWTAAVRGKKPDGSIVNAGGSDGNVSINEAFQFAKTNDSRNEHPQYYENPVGIGDKYTLAGPIALKLACGNIRQDLKSACRFIRPDLKPICRTIQQDLKPICGYIKPDIKIPDCIKYGTNIPIPCSTKQTWKCPDIILRDPDIRVKIIDEARVALKEAYVESINYLAEAGLSEEEISDVIGNVFLEINDQEANKTCESHFREISKPCFNHMDANFCRILRKVTPCSMYGSEICRVSTDIPKKCSQYRLDICRFYSQIKPPEIDPCITTGADLPVKTCGSNDVISPGGCQVEGPQIDPGKIRIDPEVIEQFIAAHPKTVNLMNNVGFSDEDIVYALANISQKTNDYSTNDYCRPILADTIVTSSCYKRDIKGGHGCYVEGPQIDFGKIRTDPVDWIKEMYTKAVINMSASGFSDEEIANELETSLSEIMPSLRYQSNVCKISEFADDCSSHIQLKPICKLEGFFNQCRKYQKMGPCITSAQIPKCPRYIKWPGDCTREGFKPDFDKYDDPIDIIQIMREEGYSEADIASQLEMAALEMAEQQKYFQMMAEEVKGSVGKHFKRMTRR